jgi:hypothetical protein
MIMVINSDNNILKRNNPIILSSVRAVRATALFCANEYCLEAGLAQGVSVCVRQYARAHSTHTSACGAEKVWGWTSYR